MGMAQWDKVFGRMSYHVVYDDTIQDAMTFASKNGFSRITIAVGLPHLAVERMGKGELSQIKKQSERLGIRLNLHAPDDLTLVHSQPSINDAIMSYYSNLIDIAHEIGAKIITVHPGTPASFPTDTESSERRPRKDTELYKEIFEGNLKKLAGMANGKTRICIENFGLEGSTIEVLDKCLKDTRLALCWDIPKMYNYKESISIKAETQRFLFRNLDRIRQVHLHSIAKGKSHMVIQDGIIIFKLYLGMLRDVDVLDYCIEVRPREKALESRENLKRMLYGRGVQ